MVTQLKPVQVEGLDKAYQDIDKLNRNARGIKIAAWVTAISTFVLAVVGIIALFK